MPSPNRRNNGGGGGGTTSSGTGIVSSLLSELVVVRRSSNDDGDDDKYYGRYRHPRTWTCASKKRRVAFLAAASFGCFFALLAWPTNRNGIFVTLSTTTSTSTTTATSEYSQECLDALRQRRERNRRHYELARRNRTDSEIAREQKSWAYKHGVFSNDTDQRIPIRCELLLEDERNEQKRRRNKDGNDGGADAVDDDRIVYFLHVHKAGGTTLCSAARANLVYANYLDDCNVASLKRCCGGNTTEKHRQFYETSPFQFVGNEWPMYDVVDTERYRYVVTLRDSVSRYRSHYKHDLKISNLKKVGQFPNWMKAQPDNFNLRMVCGDRCLQRARFQLTRGDLDYTVEKLRDDFDSIILMEDFNFTYTKFASKLGWTTWPGQKNQKKGGGTRRSSRSLVGEGEEEDEEDGNGNDKAEDVVIDFRYAALDDYVYEKSKEFAYKGDDDRLRERRADQEAMRKLEDAVSRYFEQAETDRIENDAKEADDPTKCITPCCRKCMITNPWGSYLNTLMWHGPSFDG